MSATTKPYEKVFACAGITLAIALIALGSSVLKRAEALGYLIGLFLLSALIVGWMAKRSKKAWPLWKIAAVYIVASVFMISAVIFNDVERLINKPGAKDSASIDVDKMLMQASAEVNASMPRMIGEKMRLDKVLAEPGRELVYFYTLLSHAASDIESKAFHDVMRPINLEDYCDSPEMRVFFENKVIMHHVYQGKDEGEITRVTISPIDCGANP